MSQTCCGAPLRCCLLQLYAPVTNTDMLLGIDNFLQAQWELWCLKRKEKRNLEDVEFVSEK